MLGPWDEMCRRFTRGSLYRLCIHEILPELQGVIYLDCDIVVHLDIYNLWKEYMDDGGRHTICGVYGNRGSSTPDMTVPREEIVTDKRGLNRERYILIQACWCLISPDCARNIEKAPC